ncbi:hypothetical protein Bbelb_075640 [Branchiostoma belcheri]|nr:hypothetical protein Bbelb_075640 [Branchiostoma belcheri]
MSDSEGGKILDRGGGRSSDRKERLREPEVLSRQDVITHCYPLERISARAHVLLAMNSAPRDCTGPEPVSNIKPRRTAPLPHDRDPHGFTEKPIQSNRRKTYPVQEVNIQLNCGYQKADHTGPPQSPG